MTPRLCLFLAVENNDNKGSSAYEYGPKHEVVSQLTEGGDGAEGGNGFNRIPCIGLVDSYLVVVAVVVVEIAVMMLLTMIEGHGLV